MNTKHTAGPWSVRNRLNQTPQVWNGTTGICRLDDRHDWLGETEANARLIALTPELLDSFEWAMTHVENVFALAGRHDRERPALEKARAILAKAEGKEP